MCSEPVMKKIIVLVAVGFASPALSADYARPAAPLAFDYFFWLVVFLGLLAGPSGIAAAADWEDCKFPQTEKTVPSCTSIINDSSRSDIERSRAYVNRAKVYSNDSKFDLTLSDSES